MKLPGGLLTDNSLQTSWAFKPVTGQMQLDISESGLVSNSYPEQVSSILLLALEHIGFQPVDPALVRRLSVGDRQFLLHQLSMLLDPGPHWITQVCDHCQNKFQFQFSPEVVPVKPAGTQYPIMDLELSVGKAKLRVPNGEDQETIAGIMDAELAQNILISRLLEFPNENPVPIQNLTQNDFTLVDAAVENISPEMSTEILATCPNCETENTHPIPVWQFLQKSVTGLLAQVHTLALHYHWSEREILSLPVNRRKRYLKFIDQSRGEYNAESFIANKGMLS